MVVLIIFPVILQTVKRPASKWRGKEGKGRKNELGIERNRPIQIQSYFDH